MFRVGHAGAAKWAAGQHAELSQFHVAGGGTGYWRGFLSAYVLLFSLLDPDHCALKNYYVRTARTGGGRQMTQYALRIIIIFLNCAAATPVVAGPRGGGHFGGGVHFSAGTGPIAAPHIASPQLATPHFSAPSFAPRLSAPRFSAPLMVPHS